jgi:hypothetical protein
MNSKSVLTKILTLLSLTDEVNFTDAKTKDGTILQSPTFDVGETVDVVSEDGTKTMAPDGEHEISLKDTEGNEVLIRVITKDGKIVERENVEMESDASPVTPDINPAPSSNEPVIMADATTEEAHPLPNTTDEDPRNMITDDSEETEKDPLIALSYRIAEMEKAMDAIKTKLGLEENPPAEEAGTPVAQPTGNEIAMAEVDEEELPKLDGAPLDTAVKFSADSIHKPNYGRKVGDSQSSFLSKLYN